MRVLVLSFYFRPDLSAGAFRTTSIVDHLARQAPRGSTIDVITTLPNRYRTFNAEAAEVEKIGDVTVHRIALPPHRSGMADQSRSFLAFANGVRQLVHGRYDLVYATSSRLMTATLGAWVARRTGARLYLDIRDIFAETIGDIVSAPLSSIMAPVLSAMERWTIGRADHVNLVSRGFARYFCSRYPGRTFSYRTNGVDDEFAAEALGIVSDVPSQRRAAEAPVTVLYAGNIGEGQGLHLVLPDLARMMAGRARFLVIGDGGRRPQLEAALRVQGVSSVELHDPVSRAELMALYRDADVLFLHLNSHEAFLSVLPSKVFEYGALGKPIWAGVSGYAAEFLASELTNVALFRPCNAADAARVFDHLVLGHTSRADFIAKHARSTISASIASDVLALASGGSPG